MHFSNCNLDTRQEIYGFVNTGISCGMGIPKAQTFPPCFQRNGNLPGISRPWFPAEHPSLDSGARTIKVLVPNIGRSMSTSNRTTARCTTLSPPFFYFTITAVIIPPIVTSW